jgi:hypothetical protein
LYNNKLFLVEGIVAMGAGVSMQVLPPKHSPHKNPHNRTHGMKVLSHQTEAPLVQRVLISAET